MARKRLERGAEDEALAAVEAHEGDFGAEGIAARVALTKAGLATEAFKALDRGEREAALDALLALEEQKPTADGEAQDDTREQLRRAVIGILSELAPGDPTADLPPPPSHRPLLRG